MRVLPLEIAMGDARRGVEVPLQPHPHAGSRRSPPERRESPRSPERASRQPGQHRRTIRRATWHSWVDSLLCCLAQQDHIESSRSRAWASGRRLRRHACGMSSLRITGLDTRPTLSVLHKISRATASPLRCKHEAGSVTGSVLQRTSSRCSEDINSCSRRRYDSGSVSATSLCPAPWT